MKISELTTPCYVIDEKKLTDNLTILHRMEEKTGCKILLAQKAFSCFCEYPLIKKYLSGTTSSGLFEARLSAEEMNLENHIFEPAYREEDMREITQICDHIVFNSVTQLQKYREVCLAAGMHIGLRVNPECSTQEGTAIYDPCAPNSRLGITMANFPFHDFDGVDGLHFHTLCEQNADALEKTLVAVEENFGSVLMQMKWINLGGGHHITRADYDLEKLEACICHLKKTYDLQVYLEPGEAIALDAGYLVTTVLDRVINGKEILILDASAACHMPDVLEMPYRPRIRYESELSSAIMNKEQETLLLHTELAGDVGEYANNYLISSCTCLAGDTVGEYSFQRKIQNNEKLYFEDMAIYSMVKNNTFNGMPLPDIAVMDAHQNCHVVRHFDYQDFKNRLS